MAMKRRQIVGWVAGIVLTVGAGAMSAQMTDWKLDPSHSEADFAIKHMAISTVHGTFRGISGMIHLDPANLSKSSVEATIQVASVDTGVPARDGHLKGPEFFDADKFPVMTFKSTGMARDGDGYNVAGDLTMHGITKPVVLHMDAPGKQEVDARGVAHRGFEASTTVNRQDFGLAYAGKMPGGDATVGDQVKISLDVEALHQ
jgi:polyisoprenoid-binding protein YceI